MSLDCYYQIFELRSVDFVCFSFCRCTNEQKLHLYNETRQNVNNTNDDLVSNNNDELYSQAVEIVIKQQKVSTSYIQRYLQIGYRMLRLMSIRDMLKATTLPKLRPTPWELSASSD